MNEFKYRITVGDPSSDGHGKTADYLISSNKEDKDIYAAYKIAKAKYPDLCPTNFCGDYNSSFIPWNIIDEYKKVCLNFFKIWPELESEHERDDEDGYDCYCNKEFFVELILQFTMIGDSELELKMVEDKIETLYLDSDGFGYGLFD